MSLLVTVNRGQVPATQSAGPLPPSFSLSWGCRTRWEHETTTQVMEKQSRHTHSNSVDIRHIRLRVILVKQGASKGQCMLDSRVKWSLARVVEKGVDAIHSWDYVGNGWYRVLREEYCCILVYLPDSKSVTNMRKTKWHALSGPERGHPIFPNLHHLAHTSEASNFCWLWCCRWPHGIGCQQQACCMSSSNMFWHHKGWVEPGGHEQYMWHARQVIQWLWSEQWQMQVYEAV